MNLKEIVLSFLVFYCNYLQFSSGAFTERCGRVISATGNVIGGQSSNNHPYKWIVAFRDTTTNKIFCAGSLISSKYVVSAAHCFRKKGRSSRFMKKPDDVVALVGKNDLTIANEEGSKEHNVSMIINHEDWNTESYDFDADISLILLETEVDFSQRVGTVCLPPASQSEVTGSGFIVGWGINQHENNLSTLNELSLPAVSIDECLDADDGFVISLSSRSFCAGFLNKNKSACQSDGGGGYFQFDRASRSYVLSGIITAALYDHYVYYGECRADTYSMFTSVGKFVDWIKAKMEMFNQFSSSEWVSYKLKHGKSYKNPEEETKRSMIWLENKNKIKNHNSLYKLKKVSYYQALNKFSDMSAKEFEEKYLGLKTNNLTDIYKTRSVFNLSAVPDSVDWRNRGKVTDVKHQGECESCFIFSALGAVEGQLKNAFSLSVQQVLDCSRMAYCKPGDPSEVYKYIKNAGGILRESSYPYKGIKGDRKCKSGDPNDVYVFVDGYQIVPQNEDSLKAAVATIGPISVGINIPDSLYNYAGGIYDDSKCTHTLNHAVLVVGYGTLNGNDYWIVKNTWGPDWGYNGYVFMARNRNNMCGIADYATFPTGVE